MADVPVNPASPDPLEAADGQDPSPVTPAAEPEVVPEAVEEAAVTAVSEPEVAPAPEAPVTGAETATVADTGTLAPPSEEASVAEVAPSDDTPVASEPAPEASAPEPEPEPEPEPAAPAAAPPSAPDLAAPSIAATLEAPPVGLRSGAPGSEEGGEWDLLVGKVRTFLEGGELQAWWDRLGGPLRGLGLLIGLLLVLRLYDALLDTFDDLPLVPRLLQLAGLIAVVRFALTRLVRTEDRQAVLNDWKARWQRFRG